MKYTSEQILELARKGWKEHDLTPSPYLFLYRGSKGRSACVVGAATLALDPTIGDLDFQKMEDLLEISDSFSNGVSGGFCGSDPQPGSEQDLEEYTEGYNLGLQARKEFLLQEKK